MKPTYKKEYKPISNYINDISLNDYQSILNDITTINRYKKINKILKRLSNKSK